MQFPGSLFKAAVFITTMVFGVTACNTEEGNTSVSYTPDRVYHLTVLYSNDPHPDALATYKQSSAQAKANLIQTIRAELEDNNSHLVLISVA